jgi:histidine ammonia-lyase
MELFCSAQALDFRNKPLGKGTKAAHEYIRTKLPFLENDEIMYPYLEKAEKIVYDPDFLNTVEAKIGGLE